MSKDQGPKYFAIVGLVMLGAGGLLQALSTTDSFWGYTLGGAGLLILLIAALLTRKSIAAVAAQRQTKLGMGSLVGVLAFLGVAVFLGSMAGRHHAQFDVSKTKLHTLAPQTLAVIDGLKEPVEALAFFQKVQMGREQSQQLLERLHFRNKLFTFRFVDPSDDPTLAERYQVNAYGTVVLIAGKKQETIKAVDEQNLTNALIRVLKKDQKLIYWIIGHGERALEDQGKQGYSLLLASLKQQNYQVKPLILAKVKEVPSDAALVVLAGPRKPLAEVETQRLSAFLAAGGRALIMLDPQWDGGLTDWLKQYGVVLGHDVVVDLASQQYGKSPFIPLSAAYGDHEITRPLANTVTFFTVARSVSAVKKAPAGMGVQTLVATSDASWAETDILGMREKAPVFDREQDKQGPISLGVLVTLPEPKAKPAEKGKQPARGELVVMGDSDFAANPDLGQLGNRDLILNCVSYLAQEAELVSIRPKMGGNETMMLGPFEARLVFWLPVVVIPLIFAVLGLVVFLRRRRVA